MHLLEQMLQKYLVSKSYREDNLGEGDDLEPDDAALGIADDENADRWSVKESHQHVSQVVVRVIVDIVAAHVAPVVAAVVGVAVAPVVVAAVVVAAVVVALVAERDLVNHYIVTKDFVLANVED